MVNLMEWQVVAIYCLLFALTFATFFGISFVINKTKAEDKAVQPISDAQPNTKMTFRLLKNVFLCIVFSAMLVRLEFFIITKNMIENIKDLAGVTRGCDITAIIVVVISFAIYSGLNYRETFRN